MAIPVASTELLGTFLEMLWFGVYLVIFPRTFIALRNKPLKGWLRYYLFVTMISIFILVTTHLVVDLARVFLAFTSNMDIPDAAEMYYADVDTKLNLTKNACYTSATILADALLLFRTYVVWGSNVWIVILPIAIWMLDFALSVWFTWSITEAKSGSSVLVSAAFARSKYFYSTTLALNLLCTLLIAYRIRSIQLRVNEYVSAGSRGSRAILIILESAAIYSAALAILIGTAVSNNSTAFIFLNSTPPVIGSVFSFVVLRSSSRIHTNHSTSVQSSGSIHHAGPARMPHGVLISKDGGPRVIDTVQTGVHIQLERIVHHDHDHSDDKSQHQKTSEDYAV